MRAATVLTLLCLVSVAFAINLPFFNSDLGPLDGTYYSTTCEESSSYFPIGGYIKRWYSFDAVEYIARIEHYTDPSCTNVDFILLLEGFVNYAGNVATGSIAVNMETGTAKLIPLKNATKDSLNMFCGSGFALGVERDVSTMNCPSYGLLSAAVCPMRYQLAQKANGMMYLGVNSHSLCSLDNRPGSVDTSMPLSINPRPAARYCRCVGWRL
eukprot:EC726191.1.p1 GENE.EC726191.1~~EC726191.1.p1  ORF type:complete len:221 (+),score=39.40 EC726191.1:30-665(+)